MKRQSDGISWLLFELLNISRPNSFAAHVFFSSDPTLCEPHLPHVPPSIKVWARSLGAQYSRLLLAHTQHPHSFYSCDFSVVPTRHVVALRYDVLRVAGADPGPITHA